MLHLSTEVLTWLAVAEEAINLPLIRQKTHHQ